MAVGDLLLNNDTIILLFGGPIAIGLLRRNSHSKHSFYQSLLIDAVAIAVLIYIWSLKELGLGQYPHKMTLTGGIIPGFVSGVSFALVVLIYISILPLGVGVILFGIESGSSYLRSFGIQSTIRISFGILFYIISFVVFGMVLEVLVNSAPDFTLTDKATYSARAGLMAALLYSVIYVSGSHKKKWIQSQDRPAALVANWLIIAPLSGILWGTAAYRAGPNRQLLFAALLMVLLALLIFEARTPGSEGTPSNPPADSGSVSTDQASETDSTSETQTPSGLDIMEDELVDRDDIEDVSPDE